MKLFHCADIQVRPLTRHEEFKSVFDKFYQSLLDNEADKDSIIVVCGDIVQEKDNLKPETLMVLDEFFKKLVSISKCVVVICGNHDLLEYNKERLDTLTPVLHNIDGIHFLKYSGEYIINGINFVVNSIVDNIFITDIKNTDYPIVGLYHGMLNDSKFYNDLVVTNSKIGIKNFENYDYVLLGDIHKRQYITNNIAYCGSLVQQNFGEPYNGHGYIIWDLNKEVKWFVEIKSDYGFFNIYSEEDIKNITCPKVYIKYYVNDENKLKKLKKMVEEKKCEVLREEIIINPKDNIENINFDIIEKCKADDTDILKKYIDDNDKSKEIIEYHKKLKKELKQPEDFSSNGNWTIDYLEFQNMLIYGGDYINKIKFNKGVISVCGKNAIGKSCILKLIIFALFNKTCSNNKSSIIHKNKENCYIKLDFSFTGNNGKKFSISRKGKTRIHKTRIHKDKIELETTTILYENNNCINLQDEIQTMTYLKSLIGNYEDFIMTNVFSHSYNISFLNNTDNERLKIFMRYFKLDIYEKLQNLCKKDITKLKDESNFTEGCLNGKENINIKIIKDLENKILKLNKKINSEEIVNKNTIDNDIIKLNDEYNFTKGLLNKKEIIDKNIIKNLKKELSELKNNDNNSNEIINDTIISEKYYNKIKNDKIIKTSKIITSEEIAILKNKLGNFNDEWTKSDEKEFKLLSKLNFNNVIELKDDIENPYNNIKEINKELNKIDITLFDDEIILENIEQQIKEIKNNNWSNDDEKLLNELWKQEFDNLDYNKIIKYKLIKNKNLNDYNILESKNKIINKFINDKIITEELNNILLKEINGFYDNIKENIWKSGGTLNIIDYDQFNNWYELNQKKNNYNKLIESYGNIEELENKLNILNDYNNYIELIKFRNHFNYIDYIKYKNLCDKKDNIKLKLEIEKLECCLKYIQINNYEKLINQKKIIEIENQINDNKNIIELYNKLEVIQNKLNVLETYKNIFEIEEQIDEYNKIIELYNKLEIIKNKLKILNTYVKIVDKNKMPKDILSNYINNIINKVNIFLRGFVKFQINVSINTVNDETKFEMSVLKNKINLGIADLSGYETFILNLAFKYALLKLSCINKCGCLFIDEGLDCIDSSNFSKLNNVFDFLKQTFKNILVITHIEDIRQFENHNISITRDTLGFSKIL